MIIIADMGLNILTILIDQMSILTLVFTGRKYSLWRVKARHTRGELVQSVDPRTDDIFFTELL